jgi:GntR family transcriptional regulator
MTAVDLPFGIDTRDPMPVYAQLERRIRAAITAGHLPPGTQLPTVRQLAVDLRVNANTVARVYAQLERDGVVETRRGVGTFIANPSIRNAAAGRDARHAELSRMVQRLLSDAASLGFTTEQIVAAIEHANGKETGRGDLREG